jgi:hypothetical protein
MNLKHSPHHAKPHRTHAVTANLARIQIAKRRSTRMALSASVGLSGEDRQKSSFTMSAKATNLNRHGAAVQLSRDLPVGSVVTIKNQRGTKISARIVAQLTAIQGVSTYGVEFVNQDENANNFWGITFPSNA